MTTQEQKLNHKLRTAQDQRFWAWLTTLILALIAFILLSSDIYEVHESVKSLNASTLRLEEKVDRSIKALPSADTEHTGKQDAAIDSLILCTYGECGQMHAMFPFSNDPWLRQINEQGLLSDQEYGE